MRKPKTIPNTNVKLKRGRVFMPLALNSVFYVRNDRKGLAELETLKRCLNTANYSIRIHGRNPDRLAVAAKNGQHKAQVWQTVRKADSTYFAVYIDTRNGKRESASRAMRSTYDYLHTVENERNKAKLELADAQIKLMQVRDLGAVSSEDYATVARNLANERIARAAIEKELRAKLADVQGALRTLVTFGVNHGN